MANQSDKSPAVVIYQPDSTPNPEETPKDTLALKALFCTTRSPTGQNAAKTLGHDPDQNAAV